MAKLLSLFLSLALVVSALPQSSAQTSQVVTVDDLYRMYPDAEFRQVDAAEFTAVTNDPMVNTVVIVEPAEPEPSHAVTGQVEKAVSAEPQFGPSKVERRGRRPRSVGAPDVYCSDVYCVEGFGSFDAGSSDIAVIIFVVVGVVVVAAAFVYAGYFVYDVLSGDLEQRTGWGEAGTRARVFYGGSRSGGMYGVRFGGGFSGEYADVGLMLEGGYMHGDVAVREDETLVSVSGGYGMLGPTIRWVLEEDINPMMLDMEVLAGMTTDDDLGLVSHASIGLSWGMGSTWRMGLSLGSLYMKIRETEGPVRTPSRFNLTGGMHVGRSF